MKLHYSSYYIKYGQFSLRAPGASLQPCSPPVKRSGSLPRELENLREFDPQTAEPQTDEIILSKKHSTVANVYLRGRGVHGGLV